MTLAMNLRVSIVAVLLAVMVLPAHGQSSAARHATGTFEVDIKPLALAEDGSATLRARMTIDKQFTGALQGTSQGEMLTAGTEVKGSAGYVAIETVTGVLDGRRGTFSLQHSGTLNRGAPSLTITIVPDSGTAELAGISGTLGIRIADGKHFYDLEYTLPAP